MLTLLQFDSANYSVSLGDHPILLPRLALESLLQSLLLQYFPPVPGSHAALHHLLHGLDAHDPLCSLDVYDLLSVAVPRVLDPLSQESHA